MPMTPRPGTTRRSQRRQAWPRSDGAGELDNAAGHGVRRSRRQTRGPERAARLEIIRLLDDTVRDSRRAGRQGSRLVEPNRGDLGQALEGLATPEQDPLARGVAERAPHRQRSGQPQGARTGDQRDRQTRPEARAPENQTPSGSRRPVGQSPRPPERIDGRPGRPASGSVLSIPARA